MSTQTDKIRGALMIAAADSGASRMVRSWAVDALSALSELEAQPAQDAGMTDEPVAWTTALALDVMKSNEGTPFGLIEAASKNLWGERGVPLYRLPKGRASEGDGAQTQQVVAPQENLSHTS